MTIYLVELEAYDPALPGVRTLRYSSGAGYTAGYVTVASSSGTVVEPTLNPLVTFTRSSTATRINSAGVMETVGTNVPRFDHDSETLQPLGLLVEEARTNLYRSTGNLLPTGGSWSASNTPGHIVTATSELAPNGTEYFAQITYVNGDWRQNTATFTAGGTYTGSLYCKRGNQAYCGFELHFTGGTTVIKAIRYNFDTELLSVSSGATGTVTKLRNGIVRLALTVADDGDGTNGYMLIHTSNGGLIPVGGTALYWGAMFEQGSIPSSYIPATPIFSSRSSAATYFDSTGTLQSAAAGVARFGYFYTGSEWVMPGLMVEGASTNLLGWSATQSSWSISASVSRTFFGGLAPDGTYSATKYQMLTTANISPAVNPSPTTTAGSTYSFSIHIKRTGGSWSWVRLRLDPAGGAAIFSAYVNIDTGAIGSVTAPDGAEVTVFRAVPPVDVGNGWYRVGFTYSMVTATGASIISYPCAGNNNSATVVGDEWLFWGAQLEATSAPSSYIPTPATFTGRTSSGTYYNSAGVLTTAASGVARTTYINVGGQWVLGGLLLEQAATNTVRNSTATGATAGVLGSGGVQPTNWSIFSANGLDTEVIGTGTSSGIAYVDLKISGTSTGAFYVMAFETAAATVTDAQTITTSCFVSLVGGSLSNIATVSLQNRFTGAGGSPSVAITPDATLRRYSVTSTGVTGTTGAYAAWGLTFATGAAINVTLRFGLPQQELGGAPTSPILTTGAATVTRGVDSSTSPSVSRSADTVTNPTATRAADVANVPVASFGFNATEGVLAAEFSRPSTPATGFPGFGLTAAAGNSQNAISFFISAANNIYALVRAGNVARYNPLLANIAPGATAVRVAMAYKVGDYRAAINGTLAATGADALDLPTISQLRLTGLDAQFTGYLRSVRYWPARLADADVQAATSSTPPSGAALDLDFLTYAAPTVSIANGTYTLLVGGDVSTETRTVTVSGGSHTILPSAGNSRVTSYAFYTEASGTPESTYFDARIQEPGNWSRSLYAPGTTAGESMVGAGEIVLANPDGGLDGLLDYGVGGRAVRVWTVADEATPFSAASRWATGTAEQVEVSWSRATIRLRDRLELLAKPLQTTLYAGTTTAGGQNTAEGQAEDLKGQVKPLLYGEAHNIPAVLANAFDLIYQVSDGAVQSIDAVYDAGVPLLFSADFTTITALRGASIQGGYYATAKNLGLFRVGSSPFGTVTCDATEGATSGDRTAAQIAKRMLTRMGFTASDWDAGSITALDTDNSSNVGVWIAEPTEALEAITTVLGTVGGWLLPTRMGTFEMGRMEAPAGTPVAVWTEAEMLDRGSGIERIASNDVGAGVPIWKVTVRYGRIYAVQTGEALAGCVATARRAELASEWRSVTATDAGVKTLHLNAGELTVDTLYADEADAQAEANRLLALYGTRRDRLMIPVDTDLAAAVDLGRTVTVKIQRWGYGAGRLMTVIGLTERAGAGVTDVEVWG